MSELFSGHAARPFLAGLLPQCRLRPGTRPHVESRECRSPAAALLSQRAENALAALHSILHGIILLFLFLFLFQELLLLFLTSHAL